MDATTAKQLDAKVLEQLICEAHRIEEDSTHSAKSQFEAADSWGHTNLMIGLPTTACAAIAGLAALKSLPTIACLMALAAAASSAIFTFLNPKGRSGSHLAAGNNYKTLQNDARIFRTVDCVQRATEAILVDELKLLNGRRNDLNQGSPQVSQKAFQKARAGIEEGQASYAVDASPRQG